MPWRETSFGQELDGWSSHLGEAAALFAVLVVISVVLDWALAGYFEFVAAYLSIAVLIQMRSEARLYDSKIVYGAFLGVAGGIVLALAALAISRRHILRRAVVVVLVTVLLVAFLLPWARFGGTFPGVTFAVAVFAVALAVLVPILWSQRLVLAAGTLLFTGAVFSTVTFPAGHAYGAWVGLGVAIGLVGFVVVSRPSLLGFTQPSWYALACCIAAAMFVTSLFLPWQTQCFPDGFPPYSGRCLSSNGWFTADGSAAAVLALAFVFAPLAELAAGVALLVATVGLSLQHGDFGGVRVDFGYGSVLGFAAAALIVALATVRLRAARLDRKELVRLVPVTACLAYVFAVTVPWWGVLPDGVARFFRFALPFWFAIAGALLAIGLIGLWLRKIDAGALVVAPLVLLALVVLDVIRARGIHSGSGIAVGLCLLLVLLGYIERREGLENLRVPEILRVDRI